MSSVSKNRHGVYYVRKKVPKRLEQPTAEFLGNGKSRQVFLKRTLDTKDLREANIRAKPVLIEFDRILAQAEALTVQRPMRTTLEKREIDQITNYFFAHAAPFATLGPPDLPSPPYPPKGARGARAKVNKPPSMEPAEGPGRLRVR